MGGPPASALSQPSPDPRRDHRHDHLRSLGVAARPTTLAGDRLIEVPEALRSLLPEGGLRRGSTVTVAAGDGTGATSLALALTVPVTRSGAWVAAVGLGSIGLVAATQLGAVLDRFALVPAAGEQWPVVTAALLDSVDVVLLAPGGRVRAADARRLSARARERGAVLVVLSSAGVRSAGWPEAADVHLAVRRARWEGLRGGAGHLQARTLDVVVTGRRAASRPRQREVWLPGPDGRVEVTSPADRASGGGAGSGGAGGGGAGGGGAGGHAAGSRAVPPGADEGPAAAIALVS